MKEKRVKNINLSGKRRFVPQNEFIWKPEDRADSIFFTERGRVGVIEIAQDGSEILLENIGENDFFGEICFLKCPQRRRRTLARALYDCVIVEYAPEDFRLLLSENGGLLERFLVSAAERVANLERRVSILSRRGVERKLAEILLFLAKNQGIKINSGRAGKVKIFATHEELAALTALSRPRVTAALNRFRRFGLLEYERFRPLLIEVSALEKFVENLD